MVQLHNFSVSYLIYIFIILLEFRENIEITCGNWKRPKMSYDIFGSDPLLKNIVILLGQDLNTSNIFFYTVRHISQKIINREITENFLFYGIVSTCISQGNIFTVSTLVVWREVDTYFFSKTNYYLIKGWQTKKSAKFQDDSRWSTY